MYMHNDGSRYEGEFSNNMRDGYGIYKMPTGDRYDGDWKLNKRHGYGKQYYRLVDETYEGFF